MILNMATDMNSRTNTRRTPLHFSIPQHHSCQFAYSDIFDVGEHTSVAPTHYLFTADISFLPVSRLGCDIGSTAGGGHGEPSGKQTVHCMCVCVCVGLELHNDTDLLPHCCILVHGHTHTHTLSGYGCWGGFPALTDTHQINYVLGWPKLKKTYKKCVCCFSQNSKCCSRALLRFWSPPPWYA